MHKMLFHLSSCEHLVYVVVVMRFQGSFVRGLLGKNIRKHIYVVVVVVHSSFLWVFLLLL